MILRKGAHRGFSGAYPENTMLAFEKAVEQGMEGIELDIHLSKDGEVVVAHDETLRRVAGIDRAIADMTAQELAQTEIHGGDLGLTARGVPTLREYFRFIKDKDALPMAFSSACITVICIFILNPTMGILNYMLGTDFRWLKDVNTALNSVAVVTIWMQMGLNYIFTIAALQNVDQSLYEAAAIDGAGVMRKHWHVTLPCISPTLFFLLIVNVISSFQAYAQINLMTQGGPGKFTRVFIYQIYLEAFVNGRFGVACAQSVIMFFILLGLTLLQFRLEKKVTY